MSGWVEMNVSGQVCKCVCQDLDVQGKWLEENSKRKFGEMFVEDGEVSAGDWGAVLQQCSEVV